MGGGGHRAPLHGERSDWDAIAQMANVACNPCSILLLGVSRLPSSMSPPPLGVLFGALRSVGSLVAAVLVMMGFLLWGYLVAIFFDFFFLLFRKGFVTFSGV